MIVIKSLTSAMSLILFVSSIVQVVEEFATRWQAPLPQLRILKIALCVFAQVSPVFTLNCDIVHQTISSLAL